MSQAAEIMRALTIREAVASVSLSHDEDCSCDTCKAAMGDQGAMLRILEAVSL